MPAIDVIIPCYNYARFLVACAESVVSQAAVDVRVLIIDDASSDHTPRVGSELAERHETVEFRRHSQNRGHIATYNEGFQWATSEYSLLISADDALAPGALARAVRILDSDSNIGLCYGRDLVFSSRELPAVPVSESGAFVVESNGDFLKRLCGKADNPVSTPSAVVRTSLARRLGGYRAELPHTADLELWLRIGAHADVAVLDAVQAYKRMHGRNMQVEFVAGASVGDLQQRRLAFESLFREFAHRIPESYLLDRQWKTSLAKQAFWHAVGAFESGEEHSCDLLLEFAKELDPGMPKQKCWRRLSWKRRIGRRICGVIFPILNRLPHVRNLKVQPI